MRIIFSKDRPAQLDLLLRSLQQNAPTDEATCVLWHGTHARIRHGYGLVLEDENRCYVPETEPHDFDRNLRAVLDEDTVTFFCDDDVLFRPTPYDPREFLADDRILAFSWRLSRSHLAQPAWDWSILPRIGHGYPGSLDGHTFRTADILEMIDGRTVEGPSMLETLLVEGCERFASRRPLMAAWPEQVLVGVPVNRVSEQSGCPAGVEFPQPVEELNQRFLAGERIALDRLDFSRVDSCHHELQYEWE